MKKHMYTYKNITDQDLALIGHGLVGAGDTIETHDIINSANFELVEKAKPKSKKAKKSDK